MIYRREIDGLRALAVVPVVLFHAGFETFRGGFAGVDVFFVISGYLITSIILSEKEQGAFSLINFYERRARRILPALFFTMLVCLPFTWLWMLPTDMRDFSKSLIAVSTYSSNFLFWRETGYWGAANELKPLLHTWSLAVEEQYYILFPLFLLLIWGLRRRWILISFVLIAGISLCLSQWGAYNKPSATFFLLPTRGWELAVGATIAFYFIYRPNTLYSFRFQKVINEIFGLIGVLMLVYTVHSFDGRTPFPSFYALVPTIGTGLIILFSSSDTIVGRLLGTRVLVTIGLISYSAYLWHQPLLAFARQVSLTEPSEEFLLGIVVITFPIAYLSWRYVEYPFRKKGKYTRKRIFQISAAGTVFFIAFGLLGYAMNGFEGRSKDPKVTFASIEEMLRDNSGLSGQCDGEFTMSSACRTSNEPEILIWGDSFAMHLVQGILESNPDAKLIQMTKSACGPFFDVAPVSRDFPAEQCLEFTGSVREWLLSNRSVKYVVISSPFVEYLTDGAILQDRLGHRFAADFDTVTEMLEKTLDELERMEVVPIIFSPTPGNGFNLGRCLIRAEFFGFDWQNCNFGPDDMSEIRKKVYKLLEKAGKNRKIIRLDELLCDETTCHTYLDSTILYRDGGHLSVAGSAELGKRYNFYKLIVGDSYLPIHSVNNHLQVGGSLKLSNQ